MISPNLIGIVAPLVVALISIPLNALLLMLTTKIFKIADSSYSTAIKITAILGACSFAFSVSSTLVQKSSGLLSIAQWVLVSIVLAMVLIRSFYKLDLGKTLLVWLVWFVLYIVLFVIIAFVVASVVIAFIFSGSMHGGNIANIVPK